MKFIAKPYFSLLIIVLTIVVFSNCEQKSTKQKDNSISYLALGDSYTIGTSIDVQNSWPMQLTDSLTANGLLFYETEIIATNGWTTQDLKDGIAEAKPSNDYDLVSLLIGVNNQYQGIDIDVYIAQFRELLEQAIDLAGNDTSRVFVVSIPNYGVTPFGQSRDSEKIRTELIEYNRIAEEISTDYGTPFINITTISELADDDLTLLAPDQLHPSASMYSKWVSKMLPEVQAILTE